MDRTVLRDDRWDGIKDLLPGKSKNCGVTAVNNRGFIEAVLWIARTGVLCRDLPEKYGHWHQILCTIPAMACQGGYGIEYSKHFPLTQDWNA